MSGHLLATIASVVFTESCSNRELFGGELDLLLGSCVYELGGNSRSEFGWTVWMIECFFSLSTYFGTLDSKPSARAATWLELQPMFVVVGDSCLDIVSNVNLLNIICKGITVYDSSKAVDGRAEWVSCDWLWLWIGVSRSSETWSTTMAAPRNPSTAEAFKVSLRSFFLSFFAGISSSFLLYRFGDARFMTLL